jgi:exopolyphosphatase/pppGpp-phosphohydrolase
MRLRPAFAPTGLLSKGDAGALATLVRRSLAMSTLQPVGRRKLTLGLCSRAARAVREYAMRASGDAGPTGALSREALVTAQRELLDVSADELVRRGVPEADADSLAIATTVTRTILETLRAEQAQVVDRGLREGITLEHCRRARETSRDRTLATLPD